jgi:hypothetical protein
MAKLFLISICYRRALLDQLKISENGLLRTKRINGVGHS